MTADNFCYWLQGWFELNDTIDHREGARKETLDVIRKHLDLVFTNVTKDNLGYQLLDTRFTGVSSQPLCGHPEGLQWEEQYYVEQQPSTGLPLPSFPPGIRIGTGIGRVNNETRYC